MHVKLFVSFSLLFCLILRSRPLTSHTLPNTFAGRKQALKHACITCNYEQAGNILSSMKHRLSKKDQEDLIKTTIAHCTGIPHAERIIGHFVQHVFDFNFQSTGLTPILLASIQAAKTHDGTLLVALLLADANPRVVNIKGTTLGSTLAIFNQQAKQDNCPPNITLVAQILQQFDDKNIQMLSLVALPEPGMQEILDDIEAQDTEQDEKKAGLPISPHSGTVQPQNAQNKIVNNTPGIGDAVKAWWEAL